MVYDSLTGAPVTPTHPNPRTMSTLPAGITYDHGTRAYWVRADYFLTRVAGGWELTDCIEGVDRRFRPDSAGIAALAALV